MNTNEHEPLFTDLTPEQAAVVEGGALYNLVNIECVTASADPVGGDEPYINVGGTKIWSGSLQQGGTAPINKTISSNDLISLYDDDPWPNPDDPIGSGYLNGSGLDYFGGGKGKSKYILRYRAV